MSDSLKGRCTGARLEKPGVTEVAGVHGMVVGTAQLGVGLLEFLIALLIFSMGMTGLLSAQLVAKKTSFEASQRSIATALVRDILERMRANPDQLTAYQVAGVGDETRRQRPPDIDCDTAACSAEQLAVFDLWQWESQLLGESEQDAVGIAGGLVAPLACITSLAGEVDVTISWRGVVRSATTVEPVEEGGCDAGVDDDPVKEQGDGPQRHQVTVSTFIAGR